MTTETLAIIEALATTCAAEAARQGSPAQGRRLHADEDADAGDYDALDEALAGSATSAERVAFRAAFSKALATA